MKRFFNWLFSWVHFDEKTSFLKLPVVRATIIFFVTAAITIIVMINNNGEYKVSLSAKGFNTIVKDFGFAIGVLSALIPILVLFGAQHRANIMIKQIANQEVQIDKQQEQVVEQQTQNTFTNYYKHVEEFEKYIDKLLKSRYDNVFKEPFPRILYKIVFPSNSPFNLDLEVDYDAVFEASTQKLDKSAKTIYGNIKSVANGETDDGNSKQMREEYILSAIKALPSYIGVEFKESYLTEIQNHPVDSFYQLLYQMHYLVVAAINFSEGTSREKFNERYTKTTAYVAKLSTMKSEELDFEFMNDTINSTALYIAEREAKEAKN